MSTFYKIIVTVLTLAQGISIHVRSSISSNNHGLYSNFSTNKLLDKVCDINSQPCRNFIINALKIKQRDYLAPTLVTYNQLVDLYIQLVIDYNALQDVQVKSGIDDFEFVTDNSSNKLDITIIRNILTANNFSTLRKEDKSSQEHESLQLVNIDNLLKYMVDVYAWPYISEELVWDNVQKFEEAIPLSVATWYTRVLDEENSDEDYDEDYESMFAWLTDEKIQKTERRNWNLDTNTYPTNFTSHNPELESFEHVDKPGLESSDINNSHVHKNPKIIKCPPRKRGDGPELYCQVCHRTSCSTKENTTTNYDAYLERHPPKDKRVSRYKSSNDLRVTCTRTVPLA